jgi:hypothetical protein
MEVASIRNAVIALMKGDSRLTAEVPIAKIDYGLGKTITQDYLPLSIRVVQRGADPEKEADFGGKLSNVWVTYHLGICIIFNLDSSQDEKDGEDRESKYVRLVKQSIDLDPTLGGTAVGIAFGKTLFITHQSKSDVRMTVVELAVKVYEMGGNR